MQRDYDIDANMELYNEISSPYANPIGPFVAPINRMRAGTAWDLCVFTFDWLGADLLAGRTPFCLEGTLGATLLGDLVVDASRDVLFRKNSDDSFCEVGGEAESRTGCTRLGEVLAALGYAPECTSLVFVGQRFERCVLKSVMHARLLGYDCSVVMDATFAKSEAADPEWEMGPADASWKADPTSCRRRAEEVLRTKKSAGGRLARGYLEAVGVRILPTWPLIAP